jgi:hypothetical protein
MRKDNDMGKDEYISFRTSTEVRQLLEKLAKKGYRTLSQQVEMAVIEWLKSQDYLREHDKD